MSNSKIVQEAKIDHKVVAMRVLFTAAVVLTLSGCAAPYGLSPSTSGNYATLATYRTSLAGAMSERDVKQRRLSESTQQEEIDRLTKEIRELELSVSELQWQVENAERRARATSSAAPSSSGCYTGPRGGRYTITSSGKKNYSGC